MKKLPVFLAGGALLALITYAGRRCERRAEARFRRHHSPKGRLYQIRGREVHLVCMGERRPGRPTVILEAGHGAWSLIWKKAMPGIATITRVCAYDRAGYGWSDPLPQERVPHLMVAELRALLKQAGEPGPYLLVGHSLGGALVRLYASLHPDEVSAMLWVDTIHEELPRFVPGGPVVFLLFAAVSWLGARLAQVCLVRLSGLGRLIAGYASSSEIVDQAVLTHHLGTPAYLDTLAREALLLSRPYLWQGSSPFFGELPVISLEAQYPGDALAPLPKCLWQRFRSGWRAMHADLAQRSGNMDRLSVEGGHNIMEEQPELVVEAVRSLLLASN